MRRLGIGLFFWLAACVQSPSETEHLQATRSDAPMPIARCMNFGSALEAPAEGDWGYTVRREDLARLRTAGFDTVRLPVRWSVYADNAPPYAIDPEMLARVDEITGWADQLGLNIIVNVHHYDALNTDPETHEPRLEAIWDQLARHYRGAPETLIFETLNEPHTEMTTARTDALNKRLLARLRVDHPDRWVILGTAFWGNLDALEASEPDYDPRVMLTYHDYSPFEFTHQGTPWTDQPDAPVSWGSAQEVDAMMAGLDIAAAIQERHKMPVFVGEFGVYNQVPIGQRALWTRTIRKGFEARNLPWCYWDFAGALNAYDTSREAWIPQIRAALLD